MMKQHKKKQRKSKKGTVAERKKFFDEIFYEMSQSSPSSEYGVRFGFPVKRGMD